MASSIQLLRSTIAQERPFPGNLLEGQPAVNLNFTEPGLFFKAADGSLIKFGPAAITSDGSPPNSSPQGSAGNTVGELWLDKSTNPAVLKVYDGANWIDAGSGSGGGGSGSFLRWIYTAGGGETSLSGSSGGVLLDYTPGLEEVFVNGVLITRGADYSATNGTSITNLSALTAGDVVTVTSINPLNTVQLPGQVSLLRWSALATAGQTVLSGVDSSSQQLAYTAGFEEVYVNGAFLRRGTDYTATDGTSVTLTSPLVLDDEVTVLAWTPFQVAELITNSQVSESAEIASSKLAFQRSDSGAAQRSVLEKLSDTVSPMDFGASGNGTDNDYSALMAAFATGKVVDGGGRSYATATNLEPTAFGGLINARLIRLDPGQLGAQVLKLYSFSGFVMRDVVIDRGGAAGYTVGTLSTNNVGLFLEVCSKYYLDNVLVTNGGRGTGMYSLSCSDFAMVGCGSTEQYWQETVPNPNGLNATLNRVGNTVTATFPSAHGIVSGRITVLNSTEFGYDGSYTSYTIPSPTTLQFTVGGTPTTPAQATILGVGDDIIQPFWFNNCSYFTMTGCYAKNVTSGAPGDPTVGVNTQYSSLQVRQATRWAYGGNRHFTLNGCWSTNTGQNFDFTGTVGNRNFTLNGCVASDGGTFGFKFANSAYQACVNGCIALRCGKTGFVISGETEAINPDPGDLTFTNCQVIDLGEPGTWALNDRPAFEVATNVAFDPATPLRVVFDNCHVVDRQAVPTTGRGFVNSVQPRIYPNSGYDLPNSVRCVNCTVTPAVAANNRFVGIHFETGVFVRSGNQSIPSGSWTGVIFNGSNVYDPSGLHNPSDNADKVYIKYDGFYVVSASAVFTVGAGGDGTRALRFFRGRTGDTDASVPFFQQAVAATKTTVSGTTVMYLKGGDYLEAQVFQTTGGALDIEPQYTSFSIVKTL